MKQLLCLLILSIFLKFVHPNWEITVAFNPQCKTDCDKYNMAYVKAKNETTSVHTFFAASSIFSLPSLLVVHSSSPAASAEIDWDKRHVKVESITQYYALVFLNLMEYNDTKDMVDMSNLPNNVSVMHRHYMDEHWEWNVNCTLKERVLKKGETFELDYVATGNDPIFGNHSQVRLKFMVSGSDRHNPEMPRMQMTAGLMTQVEVALDSLNSEFKQARFGLQLVLVSSQPVLSTERYRQIISSSIYDEVTPGSFKMVNVILSQRVKQDSGTIDPTHIYPPAFLQTKPVCYVDSKNRALKSSRDVLFSAEQDELTEVEQKHVKNSLLPLIHPDVQYQALDHLPGDTFGVDKQQSLSDNIPLGMRLFNVSFGTQKDDFYASGNYLVWTASLGLGTPPADKPSSLLLGIIFLMTIVLLASIVLGSLAVVVIHFRQRRAAPFARLLDSVEEVA